MYNKLIMIGSLTRDIELKYLSSGSAIAKSAIATNHRYKTQTGEQKDEVCFLDFTVFGKGAEILNQYVRKGSKVMLEGRLSFEQWKAQDGSNRSRHALIVSDFKFLDSKADSTKLTQQGNGGYVQQPSYNEPPAQQQYNAPEQNNYVQQPSYSQNQGQNNYGQQPSYSQNQGQNNYGQQSQSGMQQQEQHQPDAYVEKIPEIDIDNDEIPF